MVPQVLRLVRLGLATLAAGPLRDPIGDEVPSLLVGVAGVSCKIGAEALSVSTSSSALVVASKIATTHNNQPLAGASSEGPKESNLRRSEWLAFFGSSLLEDGVFFGCRRVRH